MCSFVHNRQNRLSSCWDKCGCFVTSNFVFILLHKLVGCDQDGETRSQTDGAFRVRVSFKKCFSARNIYILSIFLGELFM